LQAQRAQCGAQAGDPIDQLREAVPTLAEYDGIALWPLAQGFVQGLGQVHGMDIRRG
jgi:hypothetical protein